MLTFERLIARRYFLLGARRSWHAYLPALALFVTAVAVSALAYWLYHAHGGRSFALRSSFGQATLIARLGVDVLFVLVLVACVLFSRLTVFTGISIYGLFLGSAALVIVLSVMSGFEADLKTKILGSNAHVVVTRPDQPFTDYVAVREKLARLPSVLGATPYLSNEVMVASQTSLSGVVIKAIDPDTVGQVTDLARNTQVGGIEYLTAPEKLRVSDDPLFDDKQHDDKKPDDKKPDDKKPDEEAPKRHLQGILIGTELARNLRVYTGDDVNIISPFGGIGPSGPMPKSKPFRVVGIFRSGMFEYDTKYVYVALPAGQKFFAMPDEVTGIELKLTNVDKTEPVLRAVHGILGADYEVKDWKQLNRSLFSALKIEKILMFVLLCFVILVAACAIIANGIMVVLEKGREVAILKSMGASDGAVLRAFLLLGIYIGGLGTVGGILAGIGGCLAIAYFGVPLSSDVYYITTLPVKMNPYEIAAVFGAAISIALLATLWPARMAARLRPVEGLHAMN